MNLVHELVKVILRLVRYKREGHISLLHHLTEAILDLRVQSIQLLHNWFFALRG